jgi:hypothetical protein
MPEARASGGSNEAIIRAVFEERMNGLKENFTEVRWRVIIVFFCIVVVWWWGLFGDFD